MNVPAQRREAANDQPADDDAAAVAGRIRAGMDIDWPWHAVILPERDPPAPGYGGIAWRTVAVFAGTAVFWAIAAGLACLTPASWH